MFHDKWLQALCAQPQSSCCLVPGADPVEIDGRSHLLDLAKSLGARPRALAAKRRIWLVVYEPLGKLVLVWKVVSEENIVGFHHPPSPWGGQNKKDDQTNLRLVCRNSTRLQ